MTTLVVGPAAGVTDRQLQQMTRIAADRLDGTKPIAGHVGKILYHAEAIALPVTPAPSFAPIRAAAMAATEQVGITAIDRPGWFPHVTLCYSTANQPAQPIIDALGKHLTERAICVSTLSLVVQDGPEREWNWTTVGTICLHAPAVT
jgi:hypothetical protein